MQRQASGGIPTAEVGSQTLGLAATPPPLVQCSQGLSATPPPISRDMPAKTGKATVLCSVDLTKEAHCRHGHPLQPCVNQLGIVNYCNECSRKVSPPELLFRCVCCDFDLCQQCFTKVTNDCALKPVRRSSSYVPIPGSEATKDPVVRPRRSSSYVPFLGAEATEAPVVRPRRSSSHVPFPGAEATEDPVARPVRRSVSLQPGPEAQATSDPAPVRRATSGLHRLEAEATKDSASKHVPEAASDLPLHTTQKLPKFKPPEFVSPLPVPESPEPTPSFISNPPTLDQRSVLSAWLETENSDHGRTFSQWPQASDCSIDRESEKRAEFVAPPLQPEVAIIHSDALLSPEDNMCTYSASESEYDGALGGTSEGGDEAFPASTNDSALNDALNETQLVFPEVLLGAISAAELAPSPGVVPTPWGLTCKASQETPERSPEFAWYLPVPDSPDPTPPVTDVSSSSKEFQWPASPDAQNRCQPTVDGSSWLPAVDREPSQLPEVAMSRQVADAVATPPTRSKRRMGTHGSTGGTGEAAAEVSRCASVSSTSLEAEASTGAAEASAAEVYEDFLRTHCVKAGRALAETPELLKVGGWAAVICD